MKVILFRSVDNLGQAGEVVDVKRGYYRNYLGPRGYARIANRANVALVESRRKKLEALVARERAQASESAEDLNGVELTFEIRANDRGQLFGSVTTAMIAERLAEMGHPVDRRKIELADHIKSLGEFPFRIRLYPEVYADLTVKVEQFLRPEEREALEEEERRKAAQAAKEEARAAEDADEEEQPEAAAEAVSETETSAASEEDTAKEEA